MTHTYQVTGMTCENCEAKVKGSLLAIPHVTSVEVSKDSKTAVISMDEHVPLNAFQEALGGASGKYKIFALHHSEPAEQAKSWFATYKPLLLILIFISGVSFILADFNWMWFMNNFMAGFFLVFSFFKFLDLKSFAESYAMYDIVAMRIRSYGYVYPFIELLLGVSYLVGLAPEYTNIVTIAVMGISSIGVIQSVLNKQKIRCACLGAVFNLPMSTVTIIEDLLMVVMAAVMLMS